MILTLTRLAQTKRTTISTLTIDSVFQCFGLENPHHSTKVLGNTRIPCGKYKVGLRQVGGKHNQYMNKFPASHQGMLQLLDVPGFEYILIHIGNYHKDTDGCLLLGRSCSPHKGDYMVGASKLAYIDFYNKVIEAAKAGVLTIEVKDE